MERTALVTGSGVSLSDIGQALERSGYAVSLASTTGDIGDLAAAVPPASLSPMAPRTTRRPVWVCCD